LLLLVVRLCGKSTLLRMIAGLEEVSAARSHRRTAGQRRRAPRTATFAMVFQSTRSTRTWTCFVEHGLSLLLKKAERQPSRRGSRRRQSGSPERFPSALAAVSFPAGSDSASPWAPIVARPKVFLFDEPLSNLDAKLRVHNARRDQGAAPAAQDHLGLCHPDQIEAMTMADRIVGHA